MAPLLYNWPKVKRKTGAEKVDAFFPARERNSKATRRHSLVAFTFLRLGIVFGHAPFRWSVIQRFTGRSVRCPMIATPRPDSCDKMKTKRNLGSDFKSTVETNYGFYTEATRNSSAVRIHFRPQRTSPAPSTHCQTSAQGTAKDRRLIKKTI